MFHLGNHYKMDDYDMIYVMETRSKAKNAVFLLQAMGSGRYMDGKEYQKENPVVMKFCNRWRGVVRNMQLPSLKALRRSPVLRGKMIQGVKEYETQNARFAWIRDICEEDNGAWCMDRHGELYVGNMNGNGIYLFLLTINLSKVSVEGDRIMRKKQEGMRDLPEEVMHRKAEKSEKRRLKEEKRERIRHGGWEELIRALAKEKDPDISFYQFRLENASITLDMLRDMALNRSMRLHVMESGTIEISFRKGDHTAVTTITADGRVNTMMKDFLDY